MNQIQSDLILLQIFFSKKIIRCQLKLIKAIKNKLTKVFDKKQTNHQIKILI